MAKKYIVDLNEDEVSQLQAIIKRGKHKARTIEPIWDLETEGKIRNKCRTPAA
ncbi:hypothetical protein H6G95_37565 [Nostoc linckia FACHB-391]|uniref:Uncharacterized protein n=2 Tax=Nostoc TaxID=1177 RepID=A0ABR8IMJ8_9NOSO|nr:hypothetical protein [Nostoc linckia FACHB-391]MBD2651750.1 hypothetical protein [Nostoc foliaceum FACHB-393]